METDARIRESKIVTMLGRIYLSVMLVGLPLVVHDGYFDITETKTLWFVVFSIVYLVGGPPENVGRIEWAYRGPGHQ